MASVVNTLQLIFPALVVAIAAVLLCFYFYAKRKRALFDVAAATRGDVPSSAVRTVSLSENEVGADGEFDRLPPPYSLVDQPPPYSLFDPKLTNVWPGGPPPAYEMYPITLPLAPHYWRTLTGPS